MSQRIVGVVGIAVVGVAAVGVLAPVAVADAGDVLAPGVECGAIALQCRNDTGQTYRIDWTATCAYVNSGVPAIEVPEQTWIGPHSLIELGVGVNDAYCPPQTWSTPDNLNQVDNGGVNGARYSRAVVDSSHTPAPALPWSSGTGSAG
ncbi:hypothetical protein [Nocardia macrotermitis]|uniref:Uncharacterized protein n=1 Tax=Nocardia macrotermitis TaxID=2585198 RepID=A0A7K0CZK7_9NOCA|nr:hypothetical protein [Nocardia macrotermitis]MQY18114.1 hypothetical protein [Nocardia macrotermitis]